MGLTADQFSAIVAESRDDQEIVAKVKERYRGRRITRTGGLIMNPHKNHSHILIVHEIKEL